MPIKLVVSNYLLFLTDYNLPQTITKKTAILFILEH
jgi:hypothetical protein